MPLEVVCGNCHGRLLVPAVGVIVACPHCGAHLTVPAPQPVLAVSPPAPAPGRGPEFVPAAAAAPLAAAPSAAPPMPAPASTSAIPPAGAVDSAPDFSFLNDFNISESEFPSFDEATADGDLQSGPVSDSRIAPAIGDQFPFVPPSSIVLATAAPATAASSPPVVTASEAAPAPVSAAAGELPPNAVRSEQSPVCGVTPVVVPASPAAIESAPAAQAARAPAGDRVVVEIGPPVATPAEADHFPRSAPAVPHTPMSAGVMPQAPVVPSAEPESGWGIRRGEQGAYIPGLPGGPESAIHGFPDVTRAEASAATAPPAAVAASPASASARAGSIAAGSKPGAAVSAMDVASIRASVLPAAALPMAAGCSSATDNPGGTLAAAAVAGGPGEQVRQPMPVVRPAPAEALPTRSGSRARSAPAAQVVPRTWFLLVCSYASALTIWMVYSWLASDRQHQLESLPDPNPRIENGQVAYPLVPPDADVPPGHTLELGQSRRYGHIEVRPVKVTRGQVHFEHYSGDQRKKKAPEGPVLKLWLEFKNVSTDQTIAPLDPKLLLFRSEDPLAPGTFRSNHFVCRADQDRRTDRILPFDAPEKPEFNMSGQNLGRELAPGESLQTFIATEPNIDGLTGDLMWRVFFRKGYHAPTGRGVTTLIDVTFRSDQIQAEG